MGGHSTRSLAERQTSVQVQQSAYGGPIPVIFGTNRIAGNLIWQGNFASHAHTTKSGGKGGVGSSSKSTDYTYTVSAILGLGEGTITGVGDVWKDNAKTTLAALGLTLFTGAATQAAWSFLTGYSTSTNWNIDAKIGLQNYVSTPSYVNQAINYSGLAYLATQSYDLGSAASIPNHNFEMRGLSIIGGGNSDANPAAIIPQILSSQQFGVGFASAQIGSLATYSTYCQAAGIFVSPAYTQQRAAADVILELCAATNSAPVWTGGVLNIIPYGDTTITGNGTTYTPNLTPAYDLTDDDFVDNGGPPVLVTRITPADAFNRLQVQFKNRKNSYNTEVVSVEDQDAIEKYGLKIAPPITMDFICVSSIAKQVAQLALQRLLYKRNTYEFELNARYAMLEPMDIVTLTDSGLGMNKTPVRITKIEEADHGLKITAEDLPIGVAQAATYVHDDGVRWAVSNAVLPLSPAAPIIFEMPADPSSTGLAVGIAAGAQPGDNVYGGCNVWLSLDGNNYKQEGTIFGSSRYGTLSAALASAARGTDVTNTMGLTLRSDAQMLSGSVTDKDKGTTLIICGGEYLAYQTATLTGTRAYNLTTLNRGLWNTTGSAHAIGDPWVRIDDGVITLADMDPKLVGQTVYIKLTAFNLYGQQEQPLSAATAYTYAITGNMLALQTPIDFATRVGGATKPDNNATYNKVNGAWVASKAYIVGDIVTSGGSSYSCISAHTSAAGNAPPSAYWQLFASGGSGAAGADAVTASISKENLSLQAYANGTVVSFAGATGQWSVFKGATDVTSLATYAATATGCTGTVNSSGAYSVTAMSASSATLSMTATYATVPYTKVFSLTQDVFGYEIVGTLPVATLFDGRVVYLTTDKKLYRYDGTAAAWKASVAAGDVTGQLVDSQLAALAASKVTGQLTDTQLAAIAATKITGTLADSQLAAIAAAKITGTLADTQLAAIAAAKVTGTLADTQLAAIAAAKITGTITTTQIGTGSITTATIAAGAVISSSIAANTIVAGNIAANAITTAAISAGAVTTSSIAANTIVAGNIAAGAITTAAISAGAVTTSSIAANTIVAGNIAAATITGTQIAATTISSGNIAANTITAGNIAANTLTAATIAAGAITSAAIAANTIVAGNIAASTITSSNIAAGTIVASNLAAGTITANEIAAGAVTTAKLSSTQLSALFATIGTMSSAAAPAARVVITDTLISVYDASNILRVRLGMW